MISPPSRPDVLTEAPTLVLSPHLDDALLSASTFALGPPCDVWTVFAGRPDPPRTTDWDVACGFPDSDATMTARLAEDIAAFAGTPARVRRLDAWDGAYVERDVRARQLGEVRAQIEEWLDTQARDAVLLAPAGAGVEVPDAPWAGLQRRGGRRRLSVAASVGSNGNGEEHPPLEPTTAGTAQARGAGATRLVRSAARTVGRLPLALAGRALHAEYTLRRRRATAGGRLAPNPDHLALRDLALAIAAERPDTQVVLYEELPYLWHGSADDAVAELCDSRDLVSTPWSEQVDTDAKFARLRAYTSQMPVMDTAGRLLAARHLPTRERYWLLTPSSRPTPS